MIVIASLVVAVVGAKLDAPHWPFHIIAAALFLAAVLVWLRRGPARQLKSMEELGFKRHRDWLWFVAMSRGTPRGYYPLGFVAVAAFVLTEVRFPYAAVAIAAAALVVAWGEDWKRYPSEERASRKP